MYNLYIISLILLYTLTLFLTTECVITDIKEETPAPAMPKPGMSGMM